MAVLQQNTKKKHICLELRFSVAYQLHNFMA